MLGRMTADSEILTKVPEVSKVEIVKEDKFELDMSSYHHDLSEVGGDVDCNGINHHNLDADPNANVSVNESNGRDDLDADGSYVFVCGTTDDVAILDPVHDKEEDLTAESKLVPHSNLGPPNEEDVAVGVQAGELNADSRENYNNCCIVGGIDVPLKEGLMGVAKPHEGIGEGFPIATTADAVEEQNGTKAFLEPEPPQRQLDSGLKVEDPIELDCTTNPTDNEEPPITVLESDAELGESRESIIMFVEPEPQQLDSAGVKVEGWIELESTPDPKANEEPPLTVTESDAELGEAGDSHDVSVKSEEQPNLDSTSELGEGQRSQDVVLEAAGCKSPEVVAEEVKSEEKTELELAGEVEESPESHIEVTKSAETGSCRLDSGKEKLDEKTVAAPSNHDVAPEGLVGKPDGEGATVAMTDTAEEGNGTAIVESDQQLDFEVKVEDPIVSAAELVENRESIIMSLETRDSHDASVKSEQQNNIGSTAELGESHKSTQIVVLEAARCESPGVEVEEVKPEERIELESGGEVEEIAELGESHKSSQIVVLEAAGCESPEVEVGEVKPEERIELSGGEVEEIVECQIIITKSVESESHQLDNGEEKLEERNKTDLDIDAEENQESENVVTENVQSSLNQGHTAAKLANEIDAPLETETNDDSAENKVSQAQELCECIDGNQKSPELNEKPENAEILPSPVDCVRSESGIGNVSVESGERFPAGPDDCAIEEQVVGSGASLITENFPTCAADDTKPEPEVESLDVQNRGSVISCPADDEKSQIEVENGPLAGDGTSSCPAKYVSSETEIGFGSIDPEEKGLTFRCDDVHMESKVSNGDTECASGQSISNNDLDVEYHSNDSRQIGSGADVNSESEVEDSPAIDSRDMPSNDATVPGSYIMDASIVNSEGDEGTDNKIICQETVDNVGFHVHGVPTSLPEGSAADAIDGQDMGAEAVTRPFQFLIRIPRFDDEKIREQIRHAQLQVDEKTQRRDAFRAEIQIKRANCQAHGESYETAKSEERAARRLVKLKRQEIDSVQSVINRMKNAISVEDIDGRIYNMEHMIEHETLPLKEEKQFIREIKQLKHLREQLSSNMGSQDEVQQALDQRDQIEERSKILRKELDCLKDRVSKAQAAAIAAGQKCDDESKRLKELQAHFRAADDVRQEAYMHLLSLKRQLFEKNKPFRTYKDDATAASDYAKSGDREAVYRLCVNQVETIMELWNKNDEFRKEYVRCNMRSTLRRLRTLDGRSLGPDEELPVLPSYVDERVDRLLSSPGKANSMSLVSTMEQEKQMSAVEGKAADGKSMAKVAEQKNQMVKTKDTVKPILRSGSATVSGRDETEETKEEENIQMKEERELARKAEELRNKEVATELKEQRRLEEMAKAKETLERKKRNAEKAQIRAELRAQKEAEQKEKEKEKRLKKKERKKAGGGEALDDGNNDGETAPASEIPSESTNEFEIKEGPKTITKRSPKPSHFTKQSKPKSIPPPLRNRGKRRMQQWMWVIFAALLVLAVFLLGNSGFFLNLRQQRVGF